MSEQKKMLLGVVWFIVFAFFGGIFLSSASGGFILSVVFISALVATGLIVWLVQ